MRLYVESSLEALRARKFLKEWKDGGLLSEEQYERLELDTVSGLRTTNVFLRLVLFFFAVIGVAAAVALFFALTGIHSLHAIAGVCYLVFGVLAYAGAEITAARAHMYRHGLEEALAVCSVALVCLGLDISFSGGTVDLTHGVQFLVSGVGVWVSLWIWHRFGLWYAFAGAMIFALFLPTYWTESHSVQRCLICVLYAAGLFFVAAIRSRHRFDYLEQGYSLAEALLWMGIYLVANLKLSAISGSTDLWSNPHRDSGFPIPFYWTTWVVVWCLPPIILIRGVRQKDRFLIAAGMITAVLTLITNKPYLGWQRHTWDPMLLGIGLVAFAVWLRRWLAKGQDGVRHGFTAGGMEGKHQQAFGVASSVLGLVSPRAITPAPQQQSPRFGSDFDGRSGGGGASGDF